MSNIQNLDVTLIGYTTDATLCHTTGSESISIGGKFSLSGYSSGLLFHRRTHNIGQKTELSLLKVFAELLQLNFYKGLFCRFAFGFTSVGDRYPRTGIEPIGLVFEGGRGALSFASSSALPPANASRNSVNIL